MRSIVGIVFMLVIGFSYAQNDKFIGKWVGNDEGEYWRIELNADETAKLVFYEDTVQTETVDGKLISLKYKIQKKKGQLFINLQLYDGRKKIEEYPCPVKLVNDHKMIFTFVEEDDEWDITMEKLM